MKYNELFSFVEMPPSAPCGDAQASVFVDYKLAHMARDRGRAEALDVGVADARDDPVPPQCVAPAASENHRHVQGGAEAPLRQGARRLIEDLNVHT